MQVVKGRNVNTLYPEMVKTIRTQGKVAESRAGSVLVLDTPFCAVYERPDEMVLLDPARGANPGFHLAESLWMLAGRSDAQFLNNYVKDFGARFANAEGHLDGAYGPRWRSHFSVDQLSQAVEKLRRDPNDRRVVIQMWDPRVDNDPSTKDACCNQQIFPRIVDGCLDITLTCRSNDAIWGAMGANAVHFPMLGLYLAGRIGVPIGKFYQISNNYHTYESVLPKIGTPRPAILDPYTRGEVEASPIGTDFDSWDNDLGVYMDLHDELWMNTGSRRVLELDTSQWFKNEWFHGTAMNMARAFRHYRLGEPDLAREVAARITATDWRCGALLWLDQAAFRAAGRATRLEQVPAPAESDAELEVGDVRPA